MRTIVDGHKYELENFENKNAVGQLIQFIDKRPDLDGKTLMTMYDGTTTEEVLKVLINRMQYLQAKCPCRENALVITKLEESLMWLERRTADRKARGVEGKIEA